MTREGRKEKRNEHERSACARLVPPKKPVATNVKTGRRAKMKYYIAAQTRRREEGKEREWMWTAAGSQHGNQRASGSTENLTGAGG